MNETSDCDVICQKQKQTKGKWEKLGHPRDDGVRRSELKFQLVQVCNLVCGVFTHDKKRLKQHLRLFISQFNAPQLSDCGDCVKS